MRLWVLTSTVTILLFGGCTAASAQEGSEGAEFFVRDVYGFYRDDRPSSINETQLRRRMVAAHGSSNPS